MNLSRSGDHNSAVRYRASQAYHFTPFTSDTTNAIALVANRLRTAPFTTAQAIRITRIGIQVAVGGGVGALCRFGIYTNGINMQPGRLLIDCGEVSANVGAGNIIEIRNLNILLGPNSFYWLTLLLSNNCTLQMFVPREHAWHPLGSPTLDPNGTYMSSWLVTWPYGPLPDSFPLITVAAVSAALQEFLIVGDDQDSPFGNPNTTWECQTFTPGINYTIGSVKLLLSKSLDPTEDFAVEIYATAAGVPAGPILCAGTMAASAIAAGAPAWYDINFGVGTPLIAGTMYAIVVHGTFAGAGHHVHWRNSSGGGYAGGNNVKSFNSGVAWAVNASDNLFQTFSLATSSISSNARINIPAIGVYIE